MTGDCDEAGPPVWGRGGLLVWRCPRSFVTAESEVLLEDFLSRRRLGRFDIRELSAREVDAFAILEHEFRQERQNGQQNTRRSPQAF